MSKSELIVALDLPTKDEALEMCDRLEGRVNFFKVGLELFISEGPTMVQELKARGHKVFLDLKLHDIPNQVANSCRRIVNIGADMFTIHAQGGKEMILSAMEATKNEAAKASIQPPKVLGVTVLTSFADKDLFEVGLSSLPKDQVNLLTKLAYESGISGLVASPFEILAIKSIVSSDTLIVTPGIRLAGDDKDDQKRAMGPREAVLSGATHLVVGRPIIKASDPAQKATEIIELMEGAKR